MPLGRTKDAIVWNIVSLGLGSFVSGMLLMLALKSYFQGDPTFMYLDLFLLLPLFILASAVTVRRILKVIP